SLPRSQLATNDGKMLFSCNIVVDPSAHNLYSAVLQELATIADELHDVVFRNLEAVNREDIPSYEQWENNIQNTFQAFHRKRCEKVVLARKTKFTFNEPLNPWLILRQLKKVTPYSYHFCFQYNDNEVFLGAS